MLCNAMQKKINNIEDYKHIQVRSSRIEVLNLDKYDNKAMLISNSVKCCQNYRYCDHAGLVVNVYVIHNLMLIEKVVNLANGIVDTILNTWRCIFFLPDNHILIVYPDRTAVEIRAGFIFWNQYLPDFSAYTMDYLHTIADAYCVELEVKKGYDDNRKDVLVEALHSLFEIPEPEVSVSNMFLTSFFPRLDMGHMSIKIRFDSAVSDRKIFEYKYNDEAFRYIVAHSEIPLLETKGQEHQLQDLMLHSCWVLDINQMIALYNYFLNTEKRNPTDAEMEFFAQTWSEHCKHTIMSSPIDDLPTGLYQTYIQGATKKIMENKPDFCMSVFSDNAGAVRLNRQYSIACKVETHNTPCAIMPQGGAVTGVLGVNRDILGFGTGALPIANVFGFCLNNVEHEEPMYYDVYFENRVLKGSDIITGVIEGVEIGGNLSGIPTIQGFIKYGNAFKAKPLVFVGSIGLIANQGADSESVFDRVPNKGDLVVILGSKVGKDGIHGATISSAGMSNNISSRMVQKGNPFMQKKLSDALIKEMKGLYTVLTDNGAGGFSSSVGELGENGFIVDLDKTVPYLKDVTMSPWEIWVSESQERMTLAVPPENLSKLLDIAKIHGILAYEIGVFNNSKRAVVTYNKGEKVIDISTGFLHEGAPKMHLLTEKVIHLNKISERMFSDITDMVSDINICSRSSLFGMYDHEVQGNSVLKPVIGPNQVHSPVSIITPLLGKKYGVSFAQGLAEIKNEDPYNKVMIFIEEVVRKLVSVGTPLDKIALLDNFCWSNSDNRYKLWMLKKATQACYDGAIGFMTPFISGKDSMFNNAVIYNLLGQSQKVENNPVLLISGLGIIGDIKKTISPEIKFVGDLLYLVGVEYGNNYAVDLDNTVQFFKKYMMAVSKGWIVSALAVEFDGGGVTMTIIRKMLACFFDYGVEAEVQSDYNTQSIVITVNPLYQKDIEKLFECQKIGSVIAQNFLIINGNHFPKSVLLEKYNNRLY
ncbi:MAG: phosphoribosylformylglycinamidine synthase [Candidatus Xenolissoclinum pacificiensis L6]|uniref:Phosphoribosylformylglycinamidine synthase subunit PurL n=1 Tax=Candidatus Xenolissoclinum pacificiensis L6 TaxID=1401685 RepID=W2V0B2_9RICK|nr:MAG: phosphoribosylformylglycinamidine synthase [Candidatus Xenolissoclinum pacificiensis L6]